MNQFTNHQTSGDDCRESGEGKADAIHRRNHIRANSNVSPFCWCRRNGQEGSVNYQYWQWYHARVRELQIMVMRGPVANQDSGGDHKRAITRRWC